MALDGANSVNSTSSTTSATPSAATGASGDGTIHKVVEFFKFKSEDAKGLKNLGQLPMGFCVEMGSRVGEQLEDTPVGEVVQDCAEYFKNNAERNKAIRARYCERFPIIGKYMQYIGAPLDYTVHRDAYEGL